MSDEALRDRIADVLDRAYNEHDRNHWGAAQAIIDELGLRVETEPGHDPRECGCSSRAYPAESRIVGKWEPECHR